MTALDLEFPSDLKAIIKPVCNAMYDFTEEGVRTALSDAVHADVVFHAPHPWGELQGVDQIYFTLYAPLFQSVPDLERRDFIVTAGSTDEAVHWIGCAGYYSGTFVAPWLDILPTGHIVHMRFHEFYRVEAGKIVEIQAVWDIPEVMMQASCWPMAPSLGREWHVPGPALQNYNAKTVFDPKLTKDSKNLVLEMGLFMKKYPLEGGAEIMELERFWHPRMNWYGPSGIGTGRGIAGFRNWHQIPFINAMPDRGQNQVGVCTHYFAENNIVAVTGWPNMAQTVSADGWLGIAPSGQKITLRSLDFWRIENNLIRENWVLIDLLDVFDQVDIDVLARMREFNKVRPGAVIKFPVGDQ